MEAGEHLEEEVPLVEVQEQIDEFQSKVQNVLRRGGPQNEADQKLAADLTELRRKTIQPGFFKQMNDVFRGPFERAVMESGVYDKIKEHLDAVDDIDQYFSSSQ